jgi:hypothetical protein
VGGIKRARSGRKAAGRAGRRRSRLEGFVWPDAAVAGGRGKV